MALSFWNQTSLSVSESALSLTPPPWAALPSRIDIPAMVTFVPAPVTSKTRLFPPALIVRESEPGPSISRLLLITSSEPASLIVAPPFRFLAKWIVSPDWATAIV